MQNSKTVLTDSVPADPHQVDADSRNGQPLPSEKPRIVQATGDDPYLVQWDKGNPRNPQNWSVGYKIWLTAQLSMLAFVSSLASSITAPANDAIAEYTGVSREVVVLNISLYVVGFALGPILWAPISEVWGVRWSILPAMACMGIFTIGTAVSQNAASVFVTRLFAGIFGSAPVSNVSAALGHFWSREARGTAMALYAVAVVGGPTLGPTIGAAILVNPRLGWRWTEYISAIIVFLVLVITAFGYPETYGPVLLKREAQRMRQETGDPKYYHPQENIKLDVASIVTKQLSRPLLMLTTEPMVTCISFYASFVYAILYLTLEVFQIVFAEQRGWSPVVASLPFLGLFIGVLFAVGINIGFQPYYIRRSRAVNGRPVPDARLPPMAIGGFIFVIGLFLFGWTASPSIPWIVPCIAISMIGAGFSTLFQQALNLIIDIYQNYAASATGANTFLRSILAAGLPMAARPMFYNLGTGPAMSILGAVAVVMLPVPFLFRKYGLALRRRSKFAPVYEDER